MRSGYKCTNAVCSWVYSGLYKKLIHVRMRLEYTKNVRKQVMGRKRTGKLFAIYEMQFLGQWAV